MCQFKGLGSVFVGPANHSTYTVFCQGLFHLLWPSCSCGFFHHEYVLLSDGKVQYRSQVSFSTCTLAQKRVTVSTDITVRGGAAQVNQHIFLSSSSPPPKVDAAHRKCWTSAQKFYNTTGVKAGLQVQGLSER